MEPLTGAMPNLQQRFEHAKSQQHKQATDIVDSIFQLALSLCSHECQSCMTEDDMYTPTRHQQGSVDSSIRFQGSIEHIMRDTELLYAHVLVWVDDLLIYADIIDKFLSVIE